MEFQIYDVVRTYRKEEPLLLVSATVIKQTETFWFLRLCGNTYGGFRNKAKVKRDAYARTEADAWRQFYEGETAMAQAFRRQARMREEHAEMALRQIVRLQPRSEAVAS